MRIFDGYVAVDWSANGKPKRGKDSIWIASRGCGDARDPENPATRAEAVVRIEDIMNEAVRTEQRLLCGLDFPFGYPEGTAQMLTGESDWEAIWSRIAEVVEDRQDNWNNRFDAAAMLNAAFAGEGPFWGNGLEAGHSRPAEEEAVRMGGELASQQASYRGGDQERARGLEAVWCRVGRRAGADRYRSAGELATPCGRAGVAI